MKIIQHSDILSLNISNVDCFNWVKEALSQKSTSMLPPKISMKQDGHIFYNVMPCIIENVKTAGVKVVVRKPENTPALDSQISLYDTDTGKIKAIMDGNFITTMRTGAIAALSITKFAMPNYSEIGIIGLGNTARATIDILLDVIGDKKLNIKLYSYKDHAQLFIERYKQYKNIDFTIHSTYKEIIENSDVVISSVTYADKNFGEDAWFKEGCLVVPIHTMGFQNCDLFFDKVYCDDICHVEGFKYFNKFRSISEISDVLNNTKPGRENNKERIIAYNIGIALQDIYFAEKIYQLCHNKGVSFELNPPTDKFWL
ncbi:MAG: ornithine cyclodeaminase [Clostridium sp.]|uniref:ornithine cyclodeaminase n=1 Tax=Clostridium sp. TaxID=1506 RepID=UPI002908E51A|nr:ornithine cyclodeaminase [Clostridium sp.]MDU4937976.1 ornithine cyclodeaminase [Clostridium sp.]